MSDSDDLSAEAIARRAIAASGRTDITFHPGPFGPSLDSVGVDLGDSVLAVSRDLQPGEATRTFGVEEWFKGRPSAESAVGLLDQGGARWTTSPEEAQALIERWISDQGRRLDAGGPLARLTLAAHDAMHLTTIPRTLQDAFRNDLSVEPLPVETPAPVDDLVPSWDQDWVEEYDPEHQVGAAGDVDAVNDPQVAGFTREASEVLAQGADIAARETSREPDDPEAVTAGITAAAATWEQRAAHVGAAAPRITRSPAASARIAQTAGTAASLSDRVRELHEDREEAKIVDHGIDARQSTAMQRIEQLRGQATDLAYTIDPAPRPGPHLQH